MIIEIIRFMTTNEPSKMSKLIILLCVVIIASAANAFDEPENLNATLLKIENGLNDVNKKFDIAQQQAIENVEKIEEVSNVVKKNYFDKVRAIVEEANNRVKKLTIVSDDVDVTNCTKLTQQLTASALSVTGAMTMCVTEKIAEARAHINDVKTTAKNLKYSLKALKTKGLQCFNDSNSIQARAMAVGCVNVVGLEAGMTVAKTALSAARNIAGLAILLADFQEFFRLCVPMQAIVALTEESSSIIDKTKKCVEQKINDIHLLRLPRKNMTLPLL